jgi:hypothetical protein
VLPANGFRDCLLKQWEALSSHARAVPGLDHSTQLRKCEPRGNAGKHRPGVRDTTLAGKRSRTCDRFAARVRWNEVRSLCLMGVQHLESPASCEWYSTVVPAEIVLGKAAA